MHVKHPLEQYLSSLSLSSLLPLSSFTMASATLVSFHQPLSDSCHLSHLFRLFLLESESETRAGREGLDVICPNCVIFP